MVSIQVLATPMMGRLSSWSVNPMALNMARAGAWSRPSVIPRLRCLRSIGLEDYDKGSKMTKNGRRLRRCPLPHIDIDEFVPKLSLGIVLFEQLSKIWQSLDQGL